MGELLVGNDNYLTAKGLKNGADGSFINTATVTATLKDMAGNDVAGAAWPLILTYEAESNGNYRGLLTEALNIVADQYYQLIIDIEDSGLTGHWQQTIQAKRR